MPLSRGARDYKEEIDYLLGSLSKIPASIAAAIHFLSGLKRSCLDNW
jgi:hypothetical protein